MERESGKRRRIVALLLGTLVVLLSADFVNAQRPPRMKARITSPQARTTVGSPVDFIATIQNGVPPFTFKWTFRRGSPASITTTSNLPQSLVSATFGPGRLFGATLIATDSKTPRPARTRARVNFRIAAPPAGAPKSINSTSANLQTAAPTPVAEQPVAGLPDFQVVAANDLGMHCGDLDHRVASILPPFNVIHAQAIRKGNGTGLPQILTNANVQVDYSASSNPQDPALQGVPTSTIFKTNFWDPNPRLPATGNILAFDAYEPFYPIGVLAPTALGVDIGLPVPDVAQLPTLVAEQQNMPGSAAPYAANDPQPFKRFDVNLPFFTAFPFGYTLSGLNWFAADGIPVAPFDDAGRKNAYPLMRIQPQALGGNTLGVAAGTKLATVDTVAPVSAEADCFRCHTSGADGGNGEAACIVNVDANCPAGGGSRRGAGTTFAVVRVSDDPSFGTVPADASREWAADMNIVRLHDAKHPQLPGSELAASTPVVCQRCHYTPALDLAQVGPADVNGRQQTNHQTNSRVLHAFHAQMVDLFPNDMPPPNSPLRTDPGTGKPVVNALVQGKLNESCYQCHPGRVTQCLRGAMFNGGLICQDCHGSMAQVGDDFSVNLPTTGAFDLTKRVPWANEPGCQSCHTGDAVSNLGLTDPAVIRSPDGIRLIQAYRTTDTAARPIVAQNRRFAENVDAGTGNQILYRLSTDSHAGIFCEGCHGSTHAEWPVQPSTGQFVANDNMPPLQLQGHVGTVAECTVCHAAGAPLGLDGPHGLHPVGDNRWVVTEGAGHHSRFFDNAPNECRSCHGLNGEGTVLARVTAARTFSVEGRTVNLAVGRPISCDICHGNPL